MESSRYIPRMYRLALSHKSWFVLQGVAALVVAVAVILQAEGLSRIIDGAFFRRAGLIGLREPICWLATAICLRAGSIWLSELAGQEVAARIKERLRDRLLRCLIRRGPLFTQREKAGELSACVVEGVEKFDAWYSRFVPHMLAMAIVPVTLASFVLYVDWPSGVVLMLTGPLIPIFMALIGMMAQRKTQQQWAALSRMSGHFLDVLQGLPTLHLFGRSGVQSANIKRVSEQFRHATMRVLRVAFLSGMVLELAASISTAMVAVEIGVRLIAGLLDFQTGLLVLLITPEFYLPFRQLGASHHAGMEAAAAGEKIFELLDDEENENVPSSSSGRKTMELSVRPDEVRWSARLARRRAANRLSGTGANEPIIIAPMQIRFQNVSYEYPGGSTPAISDLTLNLEPGRIHLLTGGSGAGKSTVMKLLLRYIEPTKGAIYVNGRSLIDLPVETWRIQLAAVFQHPHFFDGSVLDNLRAARPRAALEDVRAAARLAEADDFVMALPEGYSTPISEAAARFSGGERQRLAIARAFLKDAPLLLFDEPASHLDAATAMKVNRAFRRLAKSRTILVIAHHGFPSGEADALFELAHGALVGSSAQPILQNASPLELLHLCPEVSLFSPK